MIGMAIGFVKSIIGVCAAIAILALVIGLIMWVGKNPHTAADGVGSFIGTVWDTVSGWGEFGKEVAPE